MRQEFRFCVGEPTGPRSTVWKIWTNRNDVYLSSRASASHTKVSLHESGVSQFSETSESFARTGRRNRERHIQRWQRRAVYPESSAVHLFRVVIPQTELRLASAEEKPAKNVVWYPSPPLGYGAYVELWLIPPLDEPPTHPQFLNDLLGILQLSNGHYVGITARYLEVEPQDNESLRQLRSRVEGMWLRPPAPGSRGWALTLSNQDIHALVEFALCPD